MIAVRARILHVITRLELGGAQHNTLYTVEHLDRGQFQAGLAWGPGDRLDDVAARIDGVERFEVAELVRPVRPLNDLKALARLRAVIREFAPQLVHTHSSKAGIVGRAAARLERVPAVVHSIHGFGFTPLQAAPVRALFVLAERIAARWTDHFVAVSDANRQLGLDLGLFDAQSVSVIRSGIALDRFAGADGGQVRRQLDLPEDARIVCQVGNFKPQKAPLDFVRVAAAVLRELPQTWFVMPGEGPLRAAAESLAVELGVAERIVFCGWWDDVPGLLAASQVSVLTSRHEGLPRAVVESLAAGVPVVATAVDGVVEVVRHGVNGFLAAAGDVPSLARGVCQLLGSSELRQEMAAAARGGLDEYDIDLMVRQQEELYRWLLGTPTS
jgi:glycosyltransferase involved in cell wall biosynthesis